MPPKNTKNKKVRINFRLPTYLDDLFTQEAKRQGIPKSKLLRKWIRETNSLELKKSPTPTKKTTYFHFNLTSELKAQIEKSANEFNFDISNYLRLVIANKLIINQKRMQKKIVPTLSEIKELWLSGRIEELGHIVKNNFEEVNPEAHYIYGLTSTTSSNRTSTCESIEYLGRSNDHNLKLISKVLKTDLFLAQNKTSQAFDIANELILQKVCTKYRYIKGNAHFHLGACLLKKEDAEGAQKQFLSALEYFDIVNHPLEIFRVYNYISHACKFDQGSDQIYLLRKCEDILNQHENNYERSWLCSQKASYYYMKEQYNKAEDLFEKGIRIAMKNGSSKQMYMGKSTLGKLLLTKEDYSKAHRIISQSINEELKFRNKPGTSLTQILFIESLHNYNESRDRLKNEIATHININKTYVQSQEYMLYSMQYLHGPTYTERESGAKNLIKLSVEGKYPQIREACQKTLQERKLQPTAV